ncbi:hypothetical protein ANANG_G00151750 [Anguilla anguilla]|uniref:Uncharacterized protein n=2 Tax=Anguilla TaxID=7935 RepID=A0A9D3M8C5_ANGAN|nr:hypothetical protein ANANG_G00151750 [Anguilla anguilla]
MAPPPLPLVEEASLLSPGPAEDPSLLPADSTSLEPLPVISEKLGFTPDPKLMDHGQASPEDADLYSTRG